MIGITRRKLTVKNLARAIEIYYQNAYGRESRPTSRTPEVIAKALIEKILDGGVPNNLAEDRLGADGNGNAKIRVYRRRWLVFGSGYELGYNANCFYYGNPELTDSRQVEQTAIAEKVKSAWRKEGFPVRRESHTRKLK